jgi:hypothetical protein
MVPSEESLDVLPAQRLGGQQSLLLETFKVVPKALRKQILFTFELGVEATVGIVRLY